MNFNELDGSTRGWMLKRFEAEEASGNPYRPEVLTELGLTEWPDIMRQAITDPDGNEVALAAALNRQGYWRATDARGRRVNVAQASERLATTEFNTWYVAGLASWEVLAGTALAYRRWHPMAADRCHQDGRAPSGSRGGCRRSGSR